MGTIWKNQLSVKTADKVTGNVFANQIPASSDDPNADHFEAQWLDSLGDTVFTSHSRMTDTGKSALEALIDSGNADAWLDVSELYVTDGINHTIYNAENKRGLVVSSPAPKHIDIVSSVWELTPDEPT